MRYPFVARTLLLALGATGAGAAIAASQAFDVYAKQNSTAFNSHDAAPLNTGLSFTAGQAISIAAAGSWNGGACGDVTADGTACFGNEPVTGINYYALIGKVGADASLDGSWFKVGTAYGGTAASSGTLFLAFLDSDSFNNTGFVTATVTLPPVPEPPPMALLVAGLGVLGFVARRRRA